MNEHFYMEIYLADTPHRRNAQHFGGGSEQLRCFNDKKVIITQIDSQKTSVYIYKARLVKTNNKFQDRRTRCEK